MGLVYGVAVMALVFNGFVVLLTWPFGDSFFFGTDELARVVFNLKGYVNIALVLMFVSVVARKITNSSRLPIKRSAPAIGILLLSIWLTWYLDANRWFSIVEDPFMAIASEVDYPEEVEVLTVTSRGRSRAYPIQFLAYHHLVRDTVGEVDFDITYCVLVDAENVFPHQADRNFELVAARRNNSIYRDLESGSWWQQQSGQAVAGDQQGAKIQAHPSFRMTFGEWRAMFPDGLVMKPQPGFEQIYSRMFPRLWPGDAAEK